MSAPNKIYVPQNFIEAGKIEELDELVVEGSIEYIRKDYLLELAKDRKQFSGQIPTEYMRGQWNAYEHLIDKLESL